MKRRPQNNPVISLRIDEGFFLVSEKYEISIGPLERNELYDLLSHGSMRHVDVWEQVQTAYHIGRKQGRRDAIG